MSKYNEKSLDIVLEDNADFGLRLTLSSITEECDSHPVSGEQINCRDVETPIDLTTITFSGSISKSLDEGSATIENFTFIVNDATSGQVEMTLTKAQVKALVTQASSERSASNPRQRFLGYYDVMSFESQANVNTRIMQGRVYISDGVTD